MAWHSPAQEDSDVEDDVEGRHQFSAEEPRRAQNLTLSPSVFSFLEETLIIFDWDDTVMPSSWVLSLLPAPQALLSRPPLRLWRRGSALRARTWDLWSSGHSPPER